MNDERDFAEKTNPGKTPLEQVFESYEHGSQPYDTPQSLDYPHPYQGHIQPPQNNSDSLGNAANILAAAANIPFCLIGLITSIIIAAAIKDNKLARFYAFQSLLLHGTLILGYILSIVTMIVGGSLDSSALATVGMVIYIGIVGGVILSFLISIIMGLLGKFFKIPGIGHLADKWSD